MWTPIGTIRVPSADIRALVATLCGIFVTDVLFYFALYAAGLLWHFLCARAWLLGIGLLRRPMLVLYPNHRPWPLVVIAVSVLAELTGTMWLWCTLSLLIHCVNVYYSYAYHRHESPETLGIPKWVDPYAGWHGVLMLVGVIIAVWNHAAKVDPYMVALGLVSLVIGTVYNLGKEEILVVRNLAFTGDRVVIETGDQVVIETADNDDNGGSLEKENGDAPGDDSHGDDDCK